MKKYTVVILAVFVVSQVAVSFLILSLANRAQKQRTTNVQLLEKQEENWTIIRNSSDNSPVRCSLI